MLVIFGIVSSCLGSWAGYEGWLATSNQPFFSSCHLKTASLLEEQALQMVAQCVRSMLELQVKLHWLSATLCCQSKQQGSRFLQRGWRSGCCCLQRLAQSLRSLDDAIGHVHSENLHRNLPARELLPISSTLSWCSSSLRLAAHSGLIATGKVTVALPLSMPVLQVVNYFEVWSQLRSWKKM